MNPIHPTTEHRMEHHSLIADVQPLQEQFLIFLYLFHFLLPYHIPSNHVGTNFLFHLPYYLNNVQVEIIQFLNKHFLMLLIRKQHKKFPLDPNPYKVE